MDDTTSVQIVQCKRNFCHVELRFVQFKDLFDAQERHEIAADHVLHNQVDVLLGLQGIRQANNEWTVHAGQGVTFVEN